MSRRNPLALDLALLPAVLLAVGGLALAYNNPLKRTLVVWSCGGNFHGLQAFAREFERRHDCRVRYTAAPVEYLLARGLHRDAT